MCLFISLHSKTVLSKSLAYRMDKNWPIEVSDLQSLVTCRVNHQSASKHMVTLKRLKELAEFIKGIVTDSNTIFL